MRIGTRVRLKKSSVYYYQAPRLWGTVCDHYASGWVGVSWSNGTINGYAPSDLIICFSNYLKAIE